MTAADYAAVPTPIGPFTVILDADGAVLASGWTSDAEKLRAVVHPTLRPAALRRYDALGEVTEIVERYHEGEWDAIDTVAVRQRSGPFLEHAWSVLRKVPAGDPLTYTEFARRSGRPDATRAAANACARNATALFVPCHRILRTDGSLGGFRWGLACKRWLLAHERKAGPAAGAGAG
ncbi:methylated-DNA--[protein]-cysteine S-methyltransferase [Nocardia vermiculata]|uniref:Methylated-DNA--[protein]-cysteine S-methyltransferase n=1 Tax=Nocardia vermiculata TaxID=257274 RepID=A0A846XT63_9NOCA|nr:methylated-DNA--[protein]-cysteine S-methyltransferase [Nocardia vermiculata]NKY48964.1 methylated-DNA--[protein]-cysteine S-methyltransferase [Nocardia vermiculata]